jgi:hypothetical protein
MDGYVAQLIESLQAAHSLQVSSAYTTGDRKGTMENFFGINRAEFPPADMLSETQLTALSHAIISLLDAHRYIVNITMIKDLPAKVLYQYLIKMWTKDIFYCNSGLAGLEFCDDDPENCNLREWCKGAWCEVDDDFVPPVYNGIYDDDGNKIDTALIPIPELCLSCQSYLTEDWEENILCHLARADKREEGEEFQCYAYKKI